MASSLAYQKINPTAPSLFDLPGEVRNTIYRHYFYLPKGLTVHLVRMPIGPEDAPMPPEARISTVHHSFLEWNPDVQGPRIADLQVDRMEAELGYRTSLLRVSKHVYIEALAYARDMNSFNVLGSSTQGLAVGYHDQLSFLPIQAVSKIRSLKISIGLIRSRVSFPVSRLDLVHWGTGTTWQTILTKMIRLQSLYLVENSQIFLFRALWLASSRCAFFVDPTTEFLVEILQFKAEHAVLREDKTSSFRFLPDTPRLIFPPVKEVVLKGTMCEADRMYLEPMEINGWKLTLIEKRENGTVFLYNFSRSHRDALPRR